MTTFLLTLVLAAPAAKPAPVSTSARNALAVAALIDRDIDNKLAEAKIPASPSADDAEFLRRLSLDLRGRVPGAERTAAFLADTDPDKRRRLVDEFLADPEYGEHFGTIWYHRMAKPTMDNRQLLSTGFRDWLAERFNANAGWDKTVREILTASGDRDKEPAAVFWLAHAEGNGKREIVPARVAADAAHLFLGVKLECCECHNHPFDEGLKQTDFWGIAAFFAATHTDHAAKKDDAVPGIHEGGAAPRRPMGKKGGAPDTAPFGQIAIPDSHGKTVRAKFLLADAPNTAGLTQLRPIFANWLTAKKNPYFARATVNKLWANFFGRGIINPIDDMRSDTKASHPELLQLLAGEFAASGFDAKHLIRCLCNSRAYQRTSRPLPENKSDEELYSHVRLKVMTADMLFDSLALVLDHAPAPAGPGGGGKGKRMVGRDAREQFRAFFHAEADDDAGVVEDYTHGMPQVLRLMNAQQLLNTTPVVERLAKAGGPEQVVEATYLRVLSRPPTGEETRRAVKYVAGSRSAVKGYGDLLWALVNSGEFLFNH